MEDNFTSFRQKVLAVVKKIPKGSVLTYKEVARRAGSPNAFRAVGNILNKNRDPRIPCHRVIRSDGRAGGYNRGAALKRKLLARERRAKSKHVWQSRRKRRAWLARKGRGARVKSRHSYVRTNV